MGAEAGARAGVGGEAGAGAAAAAGAGGGAALDCGACKDKILFHAENDQGKGRLYKINANKITNKFSHPRAFWVYSF